MNRIQVLLQKYQQKTIRPDEREELMNALRKGTFEQYEPWMDEVWQQLSVEGKAHPEAARRVYARLQTELFQRPSAQWRRTPWLKVAAALLLALGLAYYFVGYRASQRQIATGPNETRTLVLPDASVVTLNGDSELRYAATWDEEHPREVWLSGEAYFSVEHTDTDQKFIVYTNQVAVEVLGTEFNVHSRDEHPEVTLTSGSVQLTTLHQDTEERITMVPGEQVVFTEARRFRKTKTNAEVYTAWRQQELLLDNTPLSQVAELLHRQHGVTVVIQDSTLNDVTITGTYPNRDIDEVVAILADLLEADVRIERTGDRINIRRK